MSSIQYVGEVLSAFADAFQPLQDSLGSGQSLSEFLADFGWSLDPASDVNAIAAAFGSLPPLIDSIRSAVTALDSANSGTQVGAIVDAVEKLATAIKDLVTAINSLSGKTPNAAWPAPLNSADFWETFPVQILDYLLYRYLQSHSPKLFAVLSLIGVVSEDYSVPLTTARVPFTSRSVRWDRLPIIVTRPQDIPKEVYGWGGALNLHRLMTNLSGVATAFQMAAMFRDASPALLNAYYDQTAPSRQQAFELSMPIYSEISDIGGALGVVLFEIGLLPIPPADNKSAAAVGLAVYPRVTGKITDTIQLTDSLSLQIKGGFISEAAIRAEIRPTSVNIFVDTTLSAGADATAVIDAKPAAPWIPIGQASSSRFELRHAHAALKKTGNGPDVEFIIELAADDAALVIDFGEGDSFLQKVLGGASQTVGLSLALTWSSKRGLRLSGQTKLLVTIPIHESIGGVIDFDSITISFGASTAPPGVGLGVSVTGGLNIGPVAANVDRVGVQTNLAFVTAGQSPGNLGGVDLTWAFLPPKGLGLAVDAGPVSGGGYIFFDPDAGRYAGILQLTLPMIAITAIGLLDTKLPGGKKGFSFLIILTCNFPPIQLGFGFVLTGLGGLAGINRTIVVQALQDGVHSGSVDHILFPDDPVAHAAQLISDLEAIFPPVEGQYVFGPMAELGWGEPEPILIGELGILLTLPNPIVIVLLGKLELALPEPGSPIVDIKMEIAGSLDLTNKLLAIDTTIRDSRILCWSLSGDSALRLAFGDQPNFVFAIGGFNSQFQPPPNFPSLQRMTLALSTGDNPRLTLDCYMAVTSNTFQVGALASVYAKLGDFKASGDLGFDALFHFQPFTFLVDLEADVSVTGPLGFSALLHLDGHLSGPDPMHCWGTVVIHCLGTHHVAVDIPFGQPAVEAPVTPPNPWVPLKAGIERTGNWSASFPAGGEPTTSLAQSQGAASLALVDPLGGLTLRQKAVPLDRTIDKFGEASLPAPQRFAIASVSVGTLALHASSITPVTGQFAAAQFEQMSDADQLSRPSFEPMNAGVAIDAAALAFGPCQGRDYQYQTQVVDAPIPGSSTPPSSRRQGKYPLTVAAQMAAHLSGPAAKAPSRNTGLGKYSQSPSQPPAAKMYRARYVIADVVNLVDKTLALATVPPSLPIPDPPEKGAMMRMLASYYAAVPADRGKYAVMGAWELL
jgi:hypothetical protein